MENGAPRLGDVGHDGEAKSGPRAGSIELTPAPERLRKAFGRDTGAIVGDRYEGMSRSLPPSTPTRDCA